MNFGDEIKNEIIERPIKDVHCKKAFLAGLFRGAGSLYFDEVGIGLSIKISNEKLMFLISTYLMEIYGYEIREMSVDEDNLNKKDRFDISLNGDLAVTILMDLEIISEINGEFSVNFNLFGKFTQNDCCLRAFLRGIFVTAGSCTVPIKLNVNTSYHLEIIFFRPETACCFSDKLAGFGIFFKTVRRKKTFVLYLKSAEIIKDFLALLSVSMSVLKLADIIIKREVINDSNRKKNCDLGNIGRQLDATEKQMHAINEIKKHCGLDGLKQELRLVANARIRYPDKSLSELADKLNIGKSCINYRMRKILSISKKL